jgi:hypothetical protein
MLKDPRPMILYCIVCFSLLCFLFFTINKLHSFTLYPVSFRNGNYCFLSAHVCFQDIIIGDDNCVLLLSINKPRGCLFSVGNFSYSHTHTSHPLGNALIRASNLQLYSIRESSYRTIYDIWGKCEGLRKGFSRCESKGYGWEHDMTKSQQRIVDKTLTT